MLDAVKPHPAELRIGARPQAGSLESVPGNTKGG